MTAKKDSSSLRDQAIAFRLAGKSLREIKEALGPIVDGTRTEFLRGTPPPAWTRRPNAKDEVRAAARELRAQGLSYNEIAVRLDVSKSSVSLWVRDIPRPPHLTIEESQQRSLAGLRRYREGEYASREESRKEFREAATREIGKLTHTSGLS